MIVPVISVRVPNGAVVGLQFYVQRGMQCECGASITAIGFAVGFIFLVITVDIRTHIAKQH